MAYMGDDRQDRLDLEQEGELDIGGLQISNDIWWEDATFFPRPPMDSPSGPHGMCVGEHLSIYNFSKPSAPWLDSTLRPKYHFHQLTKDERGRESSISSSMYCLGWLWPGYWRCKRSWSIVT